MKKSDNKKEKRIKKIEYIILMGLSQKSLKLSIISKYKIEEINFFHIFYFLYF